jgi:hypothetical protein
MFIRKLTRIIGSLSRPAFWLLVCALAAGCHAYSPGFSGSSIHVYWHF